MGMSTTIVGFRSADDLWNKHKAVWDACAQAQVPVPKETETFFDGEEPGDRPGAEVSIEGAYKDWGNSWAQGYEVDVSKLPKDVKIIRFYNSW